MNNCPLATINCTVQPYGDDNVTGGTTQYCHVDNCTVKIIKTGNVLDIVYLDDQFIVAGCSKTDSIILLIISASNSNMGSCTQADTATVTLTEQVLHITLLVLVLLVNILIIVLIIHRRIYTTMAVLLLLAATMFSSILYIVGLIYEFMEFVWPTSNTVCIIFRVFLTTALHCGTILILEMFVVIGATFYKSFKNMPPKEKTFKEKFRMLWIFLIVAISISLLIDTIRGLLLFLNDDILITDDGYCIPLTEGEEDQAAIYHCEKRGI